MSRDIEIQDLPEMILPNEDSEGRKINLVTADTISCDWSNSADNPDNYGEKLDSTYVAVLYALHNLEQAQLEEKKEIMANIELAELTNEADLIKLDNKE